MLLCVILEDTQLPVSGRHEYHLRAPVAQMVGYQPYECTLIARYQGNWSLNPKLRYQKPKP